MEKSQLSLADYHTKHFPSVYHRTICEKYVSEFPLSPFPTISFLS